MGYRNLSELIPLFLHRSEEHVFSSDEAIEAVSLFERSFQVFAALEETALKRCMKEMTTGQTAQIHEAISACRLQGRLQRKITREIGDLFAAQGIEYCLLKGAAISLRYHAEPERRCGSDIDILVQKSDLNRASAAVEMLGFKKAEFDKRNRTFLDADIKLRSAVESKHYQLGFLAQIFEVRGISNAEARGLARSAVNHGYPTPVEGDTAFLPLMVDIHHALSLDIEGETILAEKEPVYRDGGHVLFTPSQPWIAFHSIFKLYWEAGRKYGDGFHHLVDLLYVLTEFESVDWERLLGLLERYELRAAGYFVLDRLVGFGWFAIPPFVSSRLQKWRVPPPGSDTERYNDLGDFYPRLFGLIG